jgi:uncharacterized alpha-E superfamily protein
MPKIIAPEGATLNWNFYMLSRVADSLYWMSRYLERAEHTARLLDVNLHRMLDQTPASSVRRWEHVLAILRTPAPPTGAADAYHITYTLTFDLTNSNSIVSSIAAARENARQVREQISSEMWEQVNRLFLHLRRTSMHEIWHAEPHEFFRSVKEGVHLFQGITDATLSHGEGWQWIQVGRFLERASETAAILDVHFKPYLKLRSAEPSQPLDYLEWVGLLKSCTSFEAYCKFYTANIQPESIAEFLLLNAESPRSVRYAAEKIQDALQDIARTTGTRSAGLAERLAGRLRAALDYGQVDEIVTDNMPAYLENIQRQCAQIHGAINQIYISYPIEKALVS